jgi:hypothetical protein
MSDPIRASMLVVAALACGLATAGHAQVSFEPPVPVTTAIDDGGFAPAAATNDSGTCVVAWSSHLALGGTVPGDDDEIFFARSTDGGLTFGPAAPLNTDFLTDFYTLHGQNWGDSDYDPSIAAHVNRFIATWPRSTILANLIMLARSDDGGAHWTPPAVLYGAGYASTVASDGAGTWIVAWGTDRSVAPDREIYFTRSIDDGNTWSPPAPLNVTAGVDARNDVTPRLGFAGGVWVAAWTALEPGATPQDSEVLTARSVDGGATWSAPVMLNASGPTEVANDAAPSVAGDSAGIWVATWQSCLAGSDCEALVARSTDGGLTWSAPATLNGDGATDAFDDTHMDVTAGTPGTFVAIWRRTGVSPPPQYLLVATATSVDGGLSWSAPAFVNSPAAAASVPYAADLTPRVIYDASSGRYLATWDSFDPKLASGSFGPPYDWEIVMAFAGHPCGDGTVGPGEACDDGDRGSLDCCDRTCQFDALDAVCGADADLCTLERCDGAGTCGHMNAPAGTHCDADADLCTLDRCNAAAVCEHVYEPRNDCVPPVKPRHSTLRISDAVDPAKRKLSWTWKFGSPTTFVHNSAGDNYTLCLYDGAGLLERFDVPAGGVCGPDATDCWFPSGKTDVGYADPGGTPHGITRVAFKSSTVPGKSSVKITGRGANLPVPALPIGSPPVHAVFISDQNRCYGATYSSRLTNDGTVFKGKSE